MFVTWIFSLRTFVKEMSKKKINSSWVEDILFVFFLNVDSWFSDVIFLSKYYANVKLVILSLNVKNPTLLYPIQVMFIVLYVPYYYGYYCYFNKKLFGAVGGGEQTPYTFLLKLALTFDRSDSPPFIAFFKETFPSKRKLRFTKWRTK